MFTLHMWGRESSPFLQALHFSYGVGAMISPLIAEPFLLPLEMDSKGHNNSVQNTTRKAIYTADDLKIGSAYLIVALYALLPASIAVYLFVYHRHTPQHPSRNLDINEKDDKERDVSRQNKSSKFIIIGLVILFMHIYLGLELAMGTLLTRFAFGVHISIH